mmetsp:Transcript_4313/g.9845  ORF Transcript_4313/g.9845 Transcript_4313/m.9845 type:complete len:86 (+) Transcript_4313:1688-1945(+)
MGELDHLAQCKVSTHFMGRSHDPAAGTCDFWLEFLHVANAVGTERVTASGKYLRYSSCGVVFRQADLTRRQGLVGLTGPCHSCRT